jgi:hypothetical protein
LEGAHAINAPDVSCARNASGIFGWRVGIPGRRCGEGDAYRSRYADWQVTHAFAPSGRPPCSIHINQPVTSDGEMMQGGVSLLSGEP